MISFRSILIFCILPFIFSSCGNSVKEKRDELYEKNQLYAENIIKKYAAFAVDSINDYTFSYQNKLVEQNKLFAFKGIISDISKQDSNYILLAYTTINSHSYTARIIINPESFQRLSPLLIFDYRKKQKGCFIIKLSQILSQSPSLDLDINNGDEENNPYVTVGDFGDDRILKFKGSLVDFYIKEL